MAQSYSEWREVKVIVSTEIQTKQMLKLQFSPLVHILEYVVIWAQKWKWGGEQNEGRLDRQAEQF